MGIICLICHEPVRVPVQLTCFPCRQEPPSCHDICRVCLLCARLYLGLDKPHALRSSRVKCLTCDAVACPPILDTGTSYRKDYLLMSRDRMDYPCPYPCGFRGSQMDLDRHLQDCPYRIVQCPASGGDGRCNMTYRACEERKHWSECYFYVFCRVCGDYVDKDGYFYHMHRHHGN